MGALRLSVDEFRQLDNLSGFTNNRMYFSYRKNMNWILVSLFSLLALIMQNKCFASQEESTLGRGAFDDYLIIATDSESNSLSGYYNDGKCRIFFQGDLSPVELYQRSDFGEAYNPNAKIIGENGPDFAIEIYSRAKDGFREQITIESDYQYKHKTCRRRISLDRAYDVGNHAIAVRVVKKRGAQLYQIEKHGSGVQITKDRKTVAPKRFSGVWVSKTYSKIYSPEGYLYIQWIDGKGTHSAYIKERDLYPNIY